MPYEHRRSEPPEVPPRPDPDAEQRFEIDPRRGIFKTDGTPEDAPALRETLEPVRDLPPGTEPAEEDVLREAIESVMSARPAVPRSPPLSEMIEMWLTGWPLKTPRARSMPKLLHLEDFRRRVAPAGVEINAQVKSVIVGYKAALLADGQTGRTVDNKLLTRHDLFKYALANGHYTTSHDNPVAALLTCGQFKACNAPGAESVHSHMAGASFR